MNPRMLRPLEAGVAAFEDSFGRTKGIKDLMLTTVISYIPST